MTFDASIIARLIVAILPIFPALLFSFVSSIAFNPSAKRVWM
jgi:hypothetical protein